LAIGRLNQRIADMKIYCALSGFREDEVTIFDGKLGFLEQTVSPDAQQSRLRRVLSLTKFPDLETSILNGKLDLMRLLEIRESPECRDFRHWLWSVGYFTDAELDERINGLRAKLSTFVHGAVGTAIRWISITAIGIYPPVGIPLSAIDTFLLEKVLPKSGAITFLNDLYPSVFKQ
jgi:hypothetical protein